MMGVITIENNGAYIARFHVSYSLNNLRLTRDSGKFTAGNSGVVQIPEGATNLEVTVQDEYFIASWRTIFNARYAHTVSKRFEISGTTLNPSYREVDYDRQLVIH